jgi:hypothetical protein
MLKPIVILLLLGLLPSCAFFPQPFEVTVDAMAANDHADLRSYILLPANKDVNPKSQKFREYAGILDRALQSQGFVAAANREDAQLAILLSYGVSEFTVHGGSYVQAISEDTGIHHDYRGARPTGNLDSSSNIGYFPTSSRKVTGYRTVTRTSTMYRQHVAVAAIDPWEFGRSINPQQHWSLKLSCSDKRGDLRQGFPVMLAAGLPHLASDPGKKLYLEIYETDETVQMLTDAPALTIQ